MQIFYARNSRIMLFVKKNTKNLQIRDIFCTFVCFCARMQCAHIYVAPKLLLQERMKIALIGYGKMGRMIESVAVGRGHEIVCVIDPVASAQVMESDAFRSADVAIEFSRPDAAEKNVRGAIGQGVAVVSGTTGWNAAALRDELAAQVESGMWKEGCGHPGIIWSSNYSVGVNILFAVNKYLARLLQQTGGYQPSITEVHHIHKLDAPSGTAVTLREAINDQQLAISCPIESIREGEVPGIHEVKWESEADILTLKHEAKSRQGFALGAVLAAEWLCGKRGWHTMTEVLGI